MKKLTRCAAIKKKCSECSETFDERNNCSFDKCALHPFRNGKRPKSLQPSKHIKVYCAWCSLVKKEVAECPDTECVLHPFRI